MDDIIKLAQELADRFTNSETYSEYARAKEKIEGDPDLLKKIGEFYSASEAYEARRLNGEEIHFDEERILSNQYTEIWLDENGRAYMAAKNKLTVTLGKIFEIIGTGCDI